MNPVHEYPLYPSKTNFNIILSSSGIPIKNLYASLGSLMSATYPVYHILLNLIVVIKFGEEYIL
jgi:hypothetical protein